MQPFKFLTDDKRQHYTQRWEQNCLQILGRAASEKVHWVKHEYTSDIPDKKNSSEYRIRIHSPKKNKQTKNPSASYDETTQRVFFQSDARQTMTEIIGCLPNPPSLFTPQSFHTTRGCAQVKRAECLILNPGELRRIHGEAHVSGRITGYSSLSLT